MSSEAVVQQNTRFEHAPIGPIWRNQVGAMQDPETGRVVRFGLANESKAENKEIKSSDLIGITPVLITPALYGHILGVFTAYEVKPSDWTFPRPTHHAAFAHCSAQAKFHDIVRAAGGFAGFVTNPNDIHRIIRRG